MSDNKHFDVREYIKQYPDVMLWDLVGQRGAGKTYSVKAHIVDRLCDYNEGFIYVRRWTTEIYTEDLTTVFYDTCQDKELQEKLKAKFPEFYQVHILPKGGWFWLVGENVAGDLEWVERVGKITCVAKAVYFKGGNYHTDKRKFTTILFDEVIAEGKYYKPSEPEYFEKIIMTVARSENTDIKVFITGNPDNDIEACPYFYKLHLDYERMQSNTVYLFDGVVGDKRVGNSIAFIKIAGYKAEDLLNTKAATLFGTSEAAMSLTGNVKRRAYIHIPREELNEQFKPEYVLIVETPVITEREYHRKIYVYYGCIYGEAAAVCFGHEVYKDITALYCRYEMTDFRPRRERQTYRINVPPEETYKGLKRIMSYVDSTRIIISNDDRDGSIFEQIRENS